ncbi:MAG: hypothetical protein ACRD36_02215 [Candidatus Acidiferrum sp.]
MIRLINCAILVVLASTAQSLVLGEGTSPKKNGAALDSVSGCIRNLILLAMPDPLYEDHDHWGGQKEVTRGLKWRGQGLGVYAERKRGLKNNGLWWRIKVTAPNAANSLNFALKNVRQADPQRLTFTALMSFDTDIEYERQRWDAGRRLFGASIRGRARVQLTLHCESITRVENTGKFFPDIVFRLRVISANCEFENLVSEHVAGIGGDAAKIIGDAVRANLRLWRPALEKRLLDKANAAIIKTGDTKEIHVGLSKLLGEMK